MHLRIENLYTHVAVGDDGERRWLVDHLKFDDAQAKFRWGKTKGQPLELFDLQRLRFPSGLAGQVARAARAEGIPVAVVDARPPGVPLDDAADLTWLRPYQRDAVAAVERAHRGIIWISTGGGKGEIVVALARRIPVRWLFVVHRKNLVDDIAARFMKHGSVGSLTCMSFQQLVAALRRDPAGTAAWLAQFGGVLVDEAHVQAADTFMKVTMNLPNARYRVGLSGTPLARGDRRSVNAVGALGPVIYRVRPEVLIDAGVLAKPTIRMVPVTQESKARTWPGIYTDCVARSAVRNRAVVEAAKRADKPCLVFVQHLEHGEILRERFRAAGLDVPFVSGAEPADVRAQFVALAKAGRLDVLIASVVFQEGVDIPNLASVVMAAGGKSTIAAIQKVGRALRVAPGKTTCEVWDFDDRGQRMLAQHAKARRKAYAAEGYSVVVEEGRAVVRVTRAPTPTDSATSQ